MGWGDGKGHPWQGIFIAPWMPEFYSGKRKVLGDFRDYFSAIGPGAPTNQAKRLVNVDEVIGPVVWEIHLRLEDLTKSGFLYPAGPYFTASFGCQSGAVTVNLSYGTQAVMGDSLWIDGPNAAALFAVAAPDTRAVAFAVPNPGGQPGWIEA
jgi:hypothetical protein